MPSPTINPHSLGSHRVISHQTSNNSCRSYSSCCRASFEPPRLVAHSLIQLKPQETSVCGAILQHFPTTQASHHSWIPGLEFSSLITPFSADSRDSRLPASTVATRACSLHYMGSLHATSNPILCEANQAHHPNFLALQSEPATATQFPQLASNSNTPNNLWHI